MAELSAGGRLLRGGLFITAVLLIHVLLGLAAVVSQGHFVSGATAPERYLVYYLSGDESHITFSGADREYANDLCFGECEKCPFTCYSQTTLMLRCNGQCGLYTPKGFNAVSEGNYIFYVLKNGILIENSTFKCYNRSIGECGFEIEIGDKAVFLYELPPEMKPTSLSSSS